jgi:hypothetical protein
MSALASIAPRVRGKLPIPLVGTIRREFENLILPLIQKVNVAGRVDGEKGRGMEGGVPRIDSLPLLNGFGSYFTGTRGGNAKRMEEERPKDANKR